MKLKKVISGTWEYTPPQSFRFDSLWCQFAWVNLAFQKKKKKVISFDVID